MIEILQVLVYGIVLGSVVSLGAIGVSLTFGILRFANFAHGDLMTSGAYLALFGVTVLGLPMIPAFLLAAAGTVVVAIVLDRMIYRRFRRANPVTLLISSFGAALILRSLVQIVWGPSSHVYESGIQMPVVVSGIRIHPDHIYIVAGTILLMVLLTIFLQHTRLGKAMRALSDNMDLARISGIETERVIIAMWVIAAIMAAAAGTFVGMDTRLYPVMGFHLLLPIFAAAILGGIGRPYGAIVGGMVIGIAQEFSGLFINPSYKPAVAFAILVVMLIMRPTGLFGSKS